MTSAPKVIILPYSEMAPERKVTFRCDYWALLPLLSVKKRAALRASIEEHGIKTPAVVCELGADEYLVIDAYHRISLAAELEMFADDVPLHVIGSAKDYDEKQLRDMAYTLNEDRRQLSEDEEEQLREDRRALVAADRKQGKSIRDIAKDRGISRSQVERDLAAVPGGTPEKIQGRDGKIHPAKKPVEKFTCNRCTKSFPEDEILDYEDHLWCGSCFDELEREREAANEAPKEEEPTSAPVELPAPSEASRPELAAAVDASFVKNPHLHQKTILPTKSPEASPSERSSKENRAAWTAKQEASREQHHAAIAADAKSQQQPGQLGPFSLLYVDPPWQYSAKISESRNIENHYPTLSIEELCNLDIDRICTKQCVLYLWVTAPMMAAAMKLLEAWRFEYKSCAVWVKEGGAPGMGHWWKGDAEYLIAATRGGFRPPPFAERFSSVIKAKKGKHSEKPEEVRVRLERMFPAQAKVEIFARQRAKGWTSIGNEIDGADIRELLKKGFDPRQVIFPGLEKSLTAPVIAPQEEAISEPEVELKAKPKASEEYLCLDCDYRCGTADLWFGHRQSSHEDSEGRTRLLLVERPGEETLRCHVPPGSYGPEVIRRVFRLAPSMRIWLTMITLDLNLRCCIGVLESGFNADLRNDKIQVQLLLAEQMPTQYRFLCDKCGGRAEHQWANITSDGGVLCTGCAPRSQPKQEPAIKNCLVCDSLITAGDCCAPCEKEVDAARVTQDKLLEWLTDKTTRSVKQICEGLGLEAHVVREVLVQLETTNKVIREGERRGSLYFVPSAPPSKEQPKEAEPKKATTNDPTQSEWLFRAISEMANTNTQEECDSIHAKYAPNAVSNEEKDKLAERHQYLRNMRSPASARRNTKKRGHKEVEVFCISCQTTTPLAAARSLNDYHICGSCFAKYPPSMMVTIQAALLEGHGAELTRFGQTLTHQKQTYTVTSAEAAALTADKRLVVEIEEISRMCPSTPLYEAPDYFLSLIHDAKDQDALDRATDLSDAYLPAEVGKKVVSDAITARSAQLRKKEEKASAPKKLSTEKTRSMGVPLKRPTTKKARAK